MNKFHLNALLFILGIALSACSGDNTQIIDYSLAPVGPSGLNMKAAIYQAILPSGDLLTLTTDQPSGNAVVGAYTIKKTDGTIVSSGKISNLVSSLTLIGHKSKPYSDEAIIISIDPKTVNAARDEAYITISGDKIWSGTLPITTPLLIHKPVTSRMYSRGIIGSDQELAVDVVSGDNINFVGSVTLYNNNPSFSSTATGTIIGTATNSGNDPVTSPDIVPVVEIKNSTGFFFSGIRNSSGNFFDASSNITNITGQVLTTTWGNQSFIRDTIITGVKDGTPIQQLGPISNITSSQSYSPL